MNRDYGQTVGILRAALRFGMTPSLEPISRMCEAMGNPQREYACIQVAGTNGKTSTARFTAALVCAVGGGPVGLYTSPGLTCYNDRIEVYGDEAERGGGGGRPCGSGGTAPHRIGDADFAAAIGAAVAAGEDAGVEPTEFELLTAAALWHFAQRGVEAAVLECGLGGRWDATSVVSPRVAVVTGVGLDHTRILGDTLEQIAGEKAAIIKPGSVAVLAPDLACRDVFAARAAEVGAPVLDARLAEADELAGAEIVGAFPGYQRSNIATALKAAEAFFGAPVPAHGAAVRLLAGLAIPGRFEVLREDPLLVVDAAHNPQAAAVLAAELTRRFDFGGGAGEDAVPDAGEDAASFVEPADAGEGAAAVADADEDAAADEGIGAPAGAPADVPVGAPAAKPPLPALLLGVLADKDAAGIVRALALPFPDVVVTRSTSPRTLAPEELAAIVEAETGRRPRIARDIPAALGMLAGTPLLATGSITVAGEVKRALGTS